jgi:hypothetical protein
LLKFFMANASMPASYGWRKLCWITPQHWITML